MSERVDGIISGNDILTENGYVAIEEIKETDRLICCSGWSEVGSAGIKKIRKDKYEGNVLDIDVEGKKRVSVIPKQICFSKFDFSVNAYYIILMYRQSKGFRIGLETDLRGMSKTNINYDDNYWILDITYEEQEAVFFQHLYAYRFGIPMISFESKSDKFNFPQESIDRVFDIIDTEERAMHVFEKLYMYRDYPYYIAPNKQFGTKLLTLIMFGDKAPENEEAWHGHRIFVNVDHNKINFGKTSILDPSNRSAWNINTVRKDYDELNNFANVLASFEELEMPNIIIESTYG
ncbi:MAG: hypothetical protein ACOCWO_03935, partial [Candidatus Muiribacteriaceae bacterium]